MTAAQPDFMKCNAFARLRGRLAAPRDQFHHEVLSVRAMKLGQLDSSFDVTGNGPSELGRTINFGPLEFPIVLLQDQVGRR